MRTRSTTMTLRHASCQNQHFKTERVESQTETWRIHTGKKSQVVRRASGSGTVIAPRRRPRAKPKRKKNKKKYPHERDAVVNHDTSAAKKESGPAARNRGQNLQKHM